MTLFLIPYVMFDSCSRQSIHTLKSKDLNFSLFLYNLSRSTSVELFTYSALLLSLFRETKINQISYCTKNEIFSKTCVFIKHYEVNRYTWTLWLFFVSISHLSASTHNTRRRRSPEEVS